MIGNFGIFEDVGCNGELAFKFSLSPIVIKHDLLANHLIPDLDPLQINKAEVTPLACLDEQTAGIQMEYLLHFIGLNLQEERFAAVAFG